MKGIPLTVITMALVMAAPLGLQLCAASDALAAMHVVVGNPGLQHFDSDGGVELDFGLTDQDGQPVGNLRPDNLQVFEDGKLAKILDFRGVGQGRPVDLVFVMDVTESMQPYIDAIKQNMTWPPTIATTAWAWSRSRTTWSRNIPTAIAPIRRP